MTFSRSTNTIRKVLLIKLRYIGDTVLVTPLIEALSAGLANASFDILVNGIATEILQAHPYLTNIYGFVKAGEKGLLQRLIKELRANRYDMVIDLTNNDRSMLFTRLSGAPIRIGFENRHKIIQKFVYSMAIGSEFGHVHTVDHHLKVAEKLGLTITTRQPSLYVSKETLHKVRHLLFTRGIDAQKGYVVIHHGARRWYKSWPHRNFAQLADNIVEAYGLSVVFVGGESDRESADRIIYKMRNSAFNLSGDVPLRLLPALTKGAVCLIGNDSAPIHVGTAVATPVVALFGPTDARVWGPRRQHDVTISANFPCKPCGHKNLDCPLGQDYCMSTIRVDEVWGAVRRILDKRA